MRFLTLCSVSLLCGAWPALGQSGAALTSAQIFERAAPSVALVLAGSPNGEGLGSVGTAIVARENGVLLTAWHLIRSASSLQIRFRNGETFDNVQLLGVDARRDVAAIRIAASRLPVQPWADLTKVNAGDPVTLIANPAAFVWRMRCREPARVTG